MYVSEVPNRGSKPTTLIRESYREDGKVKNRTLANVTKLPPHAIDALRRALKGKTLVEPGEAFNIESSVQHGHVDALLTAMRRLGLDKMISARRCRERDLVLGMIAARILSPASKLETTRSWHTTSLPEQLGVGGADEDELYEAMDWLLERQPAIEKKLAAKHLEPCGMVMYDLTSTWMEGTKCPLAARGYSRDGKKDKLQINLGLLADEDGRPVAVRAYPGNTADPSTVQDQLRKLKDEFGLDLVLFVGDRGMATQTQIDKFMEQGGVEWITALKSGAIRKLKSQGRLQLGLFDERNLFELKSPDYPGERLVACRNPELAEHRSRKRKELIAATKVELEKVKGMVKRGRLVDAGKIGVRVGRVINKYKMSKHFEVDVAKGELRYRVIQSKVKAEAALDGIYIIRTSLPKEVMSAEDAVRKYKRLARIERGFRSMKTVSLNVRPIYHRTEERVRAHVLLCMLAYYVEWHLRHAWAPLLFAEEVDTSIDRDPVAKAKPSSTVRRKASSKTTDDGLPVHSFRSLLGHLSSIVISRCRRLGANSAEPTFDVRTRHDAVHDRAFDLIATL